MHGQFNYTKLQMEGIKDILNSILHQKCGPRLTKTNAPFFLNLTLPYQLKSSPAATLRPSFVGNPHPIFQINSHKLNYIREK